MHVITFRQAAAATALMTVVGAAQALTLNTSALNANSTQKFSEDAVGAFTTYATTVEAAGTASDAGNYTFVLPITKVVIGSSLKPTSGDASGAALKFSRTSTTTGITRSVYLANFRIDYTAGKVLADRSMLDATGAAVTENIEIYTFGTQQALALKYKFPLGISLNEVLGPLTLSSPAIESFITGLKLPNAALVRGTLPQVDFGSLQQIIEVSFRKKAVSNKPFVAPL
nr:hypothetical protein [uncultured Aquabacterium sp.]